MPLFRVAPDHLAELNVMGYNGGRSFIESRWHFEYMPMFRAVSWTIITPGDRKVIGIRAGHTQVPPVHLNELNTLGLIATEKRMMKKKRCVR